MEKKTWSSTYPILCVFLLYLLSDFHSTHDHCKTRLVLTNRGEDAGAAAAGTQPSHTADMILVRYLRVIYDDNSDA